MASLARMTLLSTPRESDLDRITRTARKIFGTEIALISLVDKERQWFKSHIGLDTTETPRDISFCGHAIQSDQTFVVNDATVDERFKDNPLVTGFPEVRFYAGQPLTNSEGFHIGTLCVISPKARPFSEQDQEVLQDLGRMVEIVLNNRQLSETQAALLDSLVTANREKLIDALTGLWNRGGFEELYRREIARAVREKIPLAVAMIDIDHFKKINDGFGHATGDEAIKLAASLLLDSCRTTDVVARHGGEEFTVVASGVAPAMLPTLGGKILQRFRTHAILQTPQGPRPFTVSVGLSAALPASETAKFGAALLNKADEALYEAKGAGRNRFHVAGAPDGMAPDTAST